MNVVEALKERYKHLHPLVFVRSQEKAKSDVELFDILDEFPNKFPVVWNDDSRRWEHSDDLLQSRSTGMTPSNEL